jgi:hypothetical protein
MTASLGAQTPRKPLQGCSTISTSHPSVALTHSPKPSFLYSVICPDQLETRKGPWKRRKEALAAAVVLDVGFMDEHVQDQPIRIDEEVALAAFDLFAPIVAASPPFCVVFTD